ncbi:unnamed protein product, partial [Amoebophrya sp. A25]|eukprot:GSA25T00017229001.1
MRHKIVQDGSTKVFKFVNMCSEKVLGEPASNWVQHVQDTLSDVEKLCSKGCAAKDWGLENTNEDPAAASNRVKVGADAAERAALALYETRAMEVRARTLDVLPMDEKRRSTAAGGTLQEDEKKVCAENNVFSLEKVGGISSSGAGDERAQAQLRILDKSPELAELALLLEVQREEHATWLRTGKEEMTWVATAEADGVVTPLSDLETTW